MAGRYGDLDYSKTVKNGVLGGGLLVVLGFLGEETGHLLYGDLTGALNTLFTTMEFGGIVIAMIAVFVFGIALPLTE
ncbi:hypothetical protein [Halohasta litorea]|uniref:Uncharacterized protein n=1 Tax=Halohasta litorea TaxID=869891 RepID=A0ABD6D3V0_9EURY|nr:hypothetical protein [Halohasta litorea]MEA1930759.1 hypothetical protein [Euryarchaeota archaeon]